MQVRALFLIGAVGVVVLPFIANRHVLKGTFFPFIASIFAKMESSRKKVAHHYFEMPDIVQCFAFDCVPLP